MEDFLLEKSLKIKFSFNNAGELLLWLEKFLNSNIFCKATLLIETKISVKLLCLYLFTE